MNTKQKDEPVQTSTQKTPVSGGSYDEKRKKRKIIIITALISLLVAGVLVVYFLFFNKQPYSDITDPRPGTPVNQLTQEETEQRLKARYHVSVEDVKAGKLNIESINDFDRLVTLGEILVVNEVNDKALAAYLRAENKGAGPQIGIAFYDRLIYVANVNNNKTELERAVNKTIELLKASGLSEGEKAYNIERLEMKYKGLPLNDNEAAEQ